MAAGSVCSAAALRTGALARSTQAKPQRTADVDAQAQNTWPREAVLSSGATDWSCIASEVSQGQDCPYHRLGSLCLCH